MIEFTEMSKEDGEITLHFEEKENSPTSVIVKLNVNELTITSNKDLIVLPISSTNSVEIKVDRRDKRRD